GLVETVAPNQDVIDFTLNLQELSVSDLTDLIEQVGNVTDLVGGFLGDILGPLLDTVIGLLVQILDLLGGILDPVLDLLLNQLLGIITSQLPDVLNVSVGLYQTDDNRSEFDPEDGYLEASMTALSVE